MTEDFAKTTSLQYSALEDRIVIFARSGDDVVGDPGFLTRRLTMAVIKALEDLLSVHAGAKFNISSEDRDGFLGMERAGALDGDNLGWDDFHLAEAVARQEQAKDAEEAGEAGEEPIEEDASVDDQAPAHEPAGLLVTKVDVTPTQQGVVLSFVSNERVLLRLAMNREETHCFHEALGQMAVKADWGLRHGFADMDLSGAAAGKPVS